MPRGDAIKSRTMRASMREFQESGGGNFAVLGQTRNTRTGTAKGPGEMGTTRFVCSESNKISSVFSVPLSTTCAIPRRNPVGASNTARWNTMGSRVSPTVKVLDYGSVNGEGYSGRYTGWDQTSEEDFSGTLVGWQVETTVWTTSFLTQF